MRISSRNAKLCTAYIHTQETTGGGIKNKKPETINKKDNREKKKMFGNKSYYNLWRRTALRWLWPSTTTTRNDAVRGGNARDIRSAVSNRLQLLAQHSPITYTTCYTRIYTH